MPEPHKEPCPKCGSEDIYRRFAPEGKKLFSSQQTEDRTSTDFVERGVSRVCDLVLRDCIMHHCRCCGFGWDGPTLQEQNLRDFERIARRALNL